MARQAKIPTPRFNLRAHSATTDKDTPTLIILVFRYEGGRLVWSTREKARPRYWNTKTGRVKITVGNPEDAPVNQTLNDVATKAVEIFREHGGKISLEDFKAELDYTTGRRQREEENAGYLPFLPFIDYYLTKRKEAHNAKRGTWKILQTCANLVKEFVAEKRNGQVDYEGIDWNFRHDFEQWLYAPPREHSTNYAAKVVSVLGQYLAEAKERGYHNNEVHRRKGWNIKKERFAKQVLSFDELEILQQLDLSDNPRLDRVRDLFLLGAFSGLRFSDFTQLQPEHIIEEDGVQLLELFTEKTDTQVVIPVLPALKTILEKYGYHSPKKISNQKFNGYIKELCQLAGINQSVIVKRSVGGRKVEEEQPKYKLISSHTARRSFATNFYQLGFLASELMKITGHATERQFMEYINTDKRANARSMAAKIAKLMGQSPLKKVQ
jgi:integrase